VLTFKTKSQVLEVSTWTKLCDLLNASLTNREKFTLEKAQGHSLSVTDYSDGGLVLELHRGKKWEGWLSVSIKIEEARAVLNDYHDEPLCPSEGIEKRGQWLEVAMFHPAVYIGAAIIGDGPNCVDYLVSALRMSASNNELLQAVEFAIAGKWDAAHGLVQQYDDDAMAAWIHAVIHKVEGDAGNSRYWYRHADRLDRVDDEPLAELAVIREELITRKAG